MLKLSRWLVGAVASCGVVLAVASGPAQAATTCDRTWDAGGDGTTWEDVANWSGDTLPTASQHACIGAGAGTVVVRDQDVAAGSVEASSDVLVNSHLSLTDRAVVSTFTRLLIAGTLDGDGSADVTILLHFNGSMFGAGQTRVMSSGTVLLDGNSRSLGRRLRLEGTGEWSSGYWYVYPGGRIENTGTLDLRAIEPMYLQGTDAGTALVNSGTIKRSVGASTTTSISVPLANTGTIDVEAGTLAFDGGGTDAASTGAYGVTGQGGLLYLRAGLFTFGTNASLAGNTLIGGTLTTAGTVSIIDRSELRGALAGTGEFRIGGTLRWTDGSMWESGITRVLSTGTLQIALGDQADVELGIHHERTLRNEGSTVWTAHSLAFEDGTRFENAGTLDAQAPEGMRRTESSAAYPQLVNTGTITRTAAADLTTSLAVPVDNDGVIESRAGWLVLVGGADAASTGRFGTAGTDGGVNLTGDPLTLGTGAKLDGTVTIDNLLVTKGAVALDGTATLSGGLDGPGTFNVGGILTWRTGAMTGGAVGVTRVLAAGELIVDPSSCCVAPRLARTLLVEGVMDWPSGNISMDDGAVLDNRGRLDARSPSGTLYRTAAGSDAPQLLNAGTLTRSKGLDSATAIDVPLRNTGVVEAPAGTMALHWGTDAASTGRFGSATDAGTVEFSQRTQRLGDGATLNGSIIATSTLETSGVVRSDGRLELEGSISGTGRFDIGGSFDMAGGSMVGSGVTRLLSTATGEMRNATICCASYTIARTLRIEGTMRWTGGTFTLADGAVIENAGRFEALAPNGTLQRSEDGADLPRFVNLGTLARPKGADSITVFGIPLDNDGTIDLAAGQLYVAGRYTQSADGIMRLAAAGTAEGEDYGILTVRDLARLGGTLVLAPSFTPVIGDAMAPLAYESRRGTFATVTATLPAGQKAAVDYRADGARVSIVAAGAALGALSAGAGERAEPPAGLAAAAAAADVQADGAGVEAGTGGSGADADGATASEAASPVASPKAARTPTIAVPSRRAFALSAARVLGRTIRKGERLVLLVPPKGVRLDRRGGMVSVPALRAGTRLRLRLTTERGGRRTGVVLVVLLAAR